VDKVIEKPLPIGWKWKKLENLCDIVGGSTIPEKSETGETGKVYCLKVSDLDGDWSNGRVISGSPIHTNKHSAGPRMLSPGAIVFPKRGGAIATNKKRILDIHAILDPNLMGIEVKAECLECLLTSFLVIAQLGLDKMGEIARVE
jgi:type I restriction enzyme, S subunit